MISSPIPPSGHIPPPFLQCLVELEAGVTDTIATEKVSTKKMAPVKAKALTGMRQTLKKKMKEFEAVLRTYSEASRLLLLPLPALIGSRTPKPIPQFTSLPMLFQLLRKLPRRLLLPRRMAKTRQIL